MVPEFLLKGNSFPGERAEHRSKRSLASHIKPGAGLRRSGNRAHLLLEMQPEGEVAM